jgi:hypothetical protein
LLFSFLDQKYQQLNVKSYTAVQDESKISELYDKSVKLSKVTKLNHVTLKPSTNILNI